MNAMDAIAFIAERKIEEALAEGAFENLPGLGKPLQLEDLSNMPPDMRMAYTILKNSGYLEEQSGAGKAKTMRELMSSNPEESRVYGKMQRLKVMMARVRQAELLLCPEKARETEKNEMDMTDSPYLEKLIRKV